MTKGNILKALTGHALRTLLVTSLVPLSACAQPASKRNSDSTLKYGKFGEMKVFRGSGEPVTLILLLAGEGGWTERMDTLAQSAAGPSTVVLGINGPHFLHQLETGKAKCAYPAGDLENLSRFAQTTLGFAQPKSPVLIGVGSAAALSYAAHAQAPTNTFSGVVSLSFCPRYQLKKSFCPGDAMRSKPSEKGFTILPAEDRTVPGWVAIENSKETACLPLAKEFVNKVKGARLVETTDNTQLEFANAVSEVVRQAPAAENVNPGSVESLKDLPLIVIEADAKKNDDSSSDYFVVFYSGDGGWAGFDKDVSKGFTDLGIPVVGLSTLSYYWKAKSPEKSAEDFKRIISTFKAKWNRPRVLVLGYSFGADVLPFILSRIPDEQQQSVAQVTLMSSSGFGEFEFHFGHWISDSKKGLPMIPEMTKLKGKVKFQCLYGSDEKDPFCPKLDTKAFSVLKLPGGHRFDGDTANLVRTIQNGFRTESR